MNTPSRGVALTPMETRHDIILGTAQLADELGYEAFALPEGWGLDATLLLTEAASRTRRIKLVTGILSVWGRTPGTLAMTAATLHRLSGGRFVLGLGPSTRALVEGFHDARFAHPADRLREVTAKVRALLAGERALLDAVPGARPLRLGQPPVPDLPIWLAAMGDRTTRVAAELADGWFPVLVARDQLADRARALRKDREAAGRSEPLIVAAGPLTGTNATTCTPGPSPSRATATRSRPSWKRTRILGPTPASSPPWPRRSWTSSPHTARQARSATSWRGGTGPPT